MGNGGVCSSAFYDGRCSAEQDKDTEENYEQQSDNNKSQQSLSAQKRIQNRKSSVKLSSSKKQKSQDKSQVVQPVNPSAGQITIKEQISNPKSSNQQLLVKKGTKHDENEGGGGAKAAKEKDSEFIDNKKEEEKQSERSNKGQEEIKIEEESKDADQQKKQSSQQLLESKVNSASNQHSSRNYAKVRVDSFAKGSQAGSLSCNSSVNGMRWNQVTDVENINCIFVPMVSVKLKFKVVDILEVGMYEEAYCIQLQTQTDKKEQKNKNIQWAEQNYILRCSQKTKQSKKERTFQLKQAHQCINLDQDFSNFERIEYLFMSSNYIFTITKQPTVFMNKQEKDKDSLEKSNSGLFDQIIALKNTLSVVQVVRIMKDILQAVLSMHSKGIVHLELSPKYILAQYDFLQVKEEKKEEGNLRPQSQLSGGGAPLESVLDQKKSEGIFITNFCQGAGFYRKKYSSSQVASFYFMSPERAAGKLEPNDIDMAMKADMWSVGVIFYMLLTGQSPFKSRTTKGLAKKIKQGTYDLDLKEFDGFEDHKKLIHQLMQVNPDKRPDAGDALNQPIFLVSDKDQPKIATQQRDPKIYQELEKFWKQTLLKDEIRNFSNLLRSVHHLVAAFEVIFEAKIPQNMKQVANGISYIHEDFTIAQAMTSFVLPEEFNDQSNIDPNAASHLKINCTNLSNYYIQFYQTLYEKQLKDHLLYFTNIKNKNTAKKLVEECLSHAMGMKKLTSQPQSVEISALIECIQLLVNDQAEEL